MTDLEAPKKDNRMLAIGLSVAAAALLIFAALSKQWMYHPTSKVGFGPMGCKNCCLEGLRDGCGMSNGAFVEGFRALEPEGKKSSGAFAPMGWAVFGLSLVGGLALLATAFLAFKGRRPELPMSPASLALLAILGAMLAGFVFVATKPGPPGFVGISLGFWAFGAGTVVGIVGAQMLAKLIRPVDPDLAAAAPY